MYHVDNDGNVGECRVITGTCPYEHNVGHCHSVEQARQAYEHTMDNDLFPTLNSTQQPDVASANTSLTYARFQIDNNFLHNSINIGSEPELFYYASAQGQLELQRRIDATHGQHRVEYQHIHDTVTNPHFQQPELTDRIHSDATYNAHVQHGIDTLSEFVQHDIPRHTPDHTYAANALTRVSYDWMTTLTTQEQEAVSHLTSDGFRLSQYAQGYIDDTDVVIAGIIDRKTRQYREQGYEYEDANQLAHKEVSCQSAALLRTITDACAKSPSFHEPITIERGTSWEELADITGYTEHEFTGNVSHAGMIGSRVSPHARIRHIPEAASISRRVRRGFGGRVTVRIEQTSKTCPVNVSAWGSTEMEFVTNPASDYRITDIQSDNDHCMVSLQEIR